MIHVIILENYLLLHKQIVSYAIVKLLQIKNNCNIFIKRITIFFNLYNEICCSKLIPTAFMSKCRIFKSKLFLIFLNTMWRDYTLKVNKEISKEIFFKNP